jgi:colanic acid biosynthesis glycosyl transferase WcaI
MRLLLLGINFAPELTGVGKYTGEMATWFARRGHEVTVVTAPPYYPSWRIFPGHRGWTWKKEKWNGCTVIRCPIYVPLRASGINRLSHLFSFALSSLPAAIVAALGKKPDIIGSIVPTLLSSPTVLALARLTGAKSWIHVQDFEFEAAYQLGLLQHGWLQHRAAAFENGLLNRFDLASSISPKMVERLETKGVASDRCFLFPNWVDTELIRPLGSPNRLRQELMLPEDRIIALYSGSMGEKHGLDILISVARRLAARSGSAQSPLILICGNGPARATLEGLAQGLSNVRFIDLQPSDRLNELLNLADIHLLPQRADVADLVMPSKLGPMLASGRPVIATAETATQITAALANSGMVVPPGDVVALTEGILRLTADSELRQRLGKAGRRQAEAEFGTEGVLKSIEGRLLKLTGVSPVESRLIAPEVDAI